MSQEDPRYQVNLFHPKKGGMRDEVLIIFVVLFGWALFTFGFQLLLAACQGTGAGSILAGLTLFNLPLHFWFTGQLLPLWFIFNLYLDRITEYHSRKRDRSYE